MSNKTLYIVFRILYYQTENENRSKRIFRYQKGYFIDHLKYRPFFTLVLQCKKAHH